MLAVKAGFGRSARADYASVCWANPCLPVLLAVVIVLCWLCCCIYLLLLLLLLLLLFLALAAT
jgi:hypothetical protein